ncbi:hypothetical protein [Aegicerativicinus sediminis]|uniref:hypothetical protein n=1 Tax=Aegicerativicinus sediminis TaxID=2893202 RepID=UPI001E31AE19|nr:hypothetical protein [Aegicerativicinus sediminis]
MEHFLRTDSKNPNFENLVSDLDSEPFHLNSEEHQFYFQYNTIDKLAHVLIFYRDNKAISCGALKKFDKNTMVVKRIYTIPSEWRGIGYALIV